MKVLISNKFYYNRGGDCIASIGLEELLKKKGHEVAFFSMQHPNNFKSNWDSYFPSQVDFQSTTIDGKLRAMQRCFSSQEVKRLFNSILDNFQPDVVHLNNIHSQLSPIIGEIAHQRGIKIVWTLHDYKLICPSYSCLREDKPCELCIQQGVSNVLLKKCMKKSLPASLIAYMEALYWNRKRLVKFTDRFIAPSLFMKHLMIKGGFPEKKIEIVHNFTNREYSDIILTKKDYYCYVGRLSEEKGVKTLVSVAKELPYKLILIGDGPIKRSLSDQASNNIEFVGFKEWNEMRSLIANAKFTVVPSEWYENNPLTVIEAQCLGTPVLGANIGGIPETLASKDNGLLFRSGDAEDLKKGIETMFEKEFNYTKISNSAREMFSAENYYNKIIKIYEQ